MKSYLSEAIILILIVVILLMKFCGNGNKPCPEAKPQIITETKWVHDTVVHEIKVPTPPLTDVEFVEVPTDKPIDTAAVIQNFYNNYFYEQEICDSNIIAMIRETVSRNAIVDRQLFYQILRPTEIINNTIITPPAEQRVKVLAGFRIGGTKQELTTISPELELITRDDKAFSVGYNLNAKAVELGMKWKISFRKN